MNLDIIIPGDVCDELPQLPDNSIQAIIADPPYYNVLQEDWDTQWSMSQEYLDWSKIWTSECMRILRPDGLFFCFGQLGKREHVFIHLMAQLCQTFQFHDLLIWDRVVGYNDRRDSYTPAYEMVLVLRKSTSPKFNKNAVREPYDQKTIEAYLRDTRYKDKEARLHHLTSGKYSTNIIRIPSLKGSSKEKCGHPSQKPLELISKLILSSTDSGDVVLDPFLGSGTTAVAAKSLNRHWIGIELDAKFCLIAENRLKSIESPHAFVDIAVETERV